MLKEWNSHSGDVRQISDWIKDQRAILQQLTDQSHVTSHDAVRMQLNKMEAIRSEALLKQDVLDELEMKMQVMNPESDLFNMKNDLMELCNQVSCYESFTMFIHASEVV